MAGCAESNLVVVVKSEGFEVLQFPQIPQLHRAVLSTCRHKVRGQGTGDPNSSCLSHGQTPNDRA